MQIAGFSTGAKDSRNLFKYELYNRNSIATVLMHHQLMGQLCLQNMYLINIYLKYFSAWHIFNKIKGRMNFTCSISALLTIPCQQ
jgi:hypothetical protein